MVRNGRFKVGDGNVCRANQLDKSFIERLRLGHPGITEIARRYETPAFHGATSSRNRMAWIGQSFMLGRKSTRSRNTEATNCSRTLASKNCCLLRSAISSGKRL